MKYLMFFCLVVLIGVSNAGVTEPTHSRGCIYINGRCSQECPEGTHGYSVGCGVLQPEATCDNPSPKADPRAGMICDYSACYCDEPTVRDPVSKKCVAVEDCPKEKTE